MKNILKKVALVATLGLALAWNGVANAATTKEQLATITDPVALKKIADDATEDASIRGLAVHKLPVVQQADYYNNATWLPLAWRPVISYTLSYVGLLKTSQYPAAIADFVSAGNINISAMQANYIKQLLKDGNTSQALAESKRLLGLTKIDQAQLLRAVNTIAGVIKSDALKNGASVKDAVAAMNVYLEAVNKGDVSKVPFTSLPYPTADATNTASESSSNLTVAALALLYDGKYDAASAKGNQMLLAATSQYEIDNALFVMGAAANGKAGLPTAANAVMDAQK